MKPCRTIITWFISLRYFYRTDPAVMTRCQAQVALLTFAPSVCATREVFIREAKQNLLLTLCTGTYAGIGMKLALDIRISAIREF